MSMLFSYAYSLYPISPGGTYRMVLSYIYILIGILFILYTVALGLGAHGSMFFVIWGILGAAAIAVGILKLKGFSLPRTPLIIIRVIVAALLILFIFVEGLILSYFGRNTDKPVDYIIVAGAQVYANSPSPVLKYRLDKALEYLNSYPDTICIVTGGKGSNELRPEAEIMAEYLIARGISSDRIITENRSTNTTENMKNAAVLFDASNSTAAIVTNNFHLFRSVMIARKQGITDAGGISADSTLLFLPNNLLREFCGVCKDFLFGNM